MQQIADWLKKLGMAEYTQRFAENRIDLSVLPDLTDQDLEKLGVLLGDRRKMQRAIRDLGNVSVAVTAPSEPLATEPTRRDDAERRQLTVMFTDLVGSTALSTKLDPEDMRSVIGAYQQCVAKTVALFDGFVAKYMGDGVLVYFGYPQAHEDDAERGSGGIGAHWRGRQVARPRAPPGAHRGRYLSNAQVVNTGEFLRDGFRSRRRPPRNRPDVSAFTRPKTLARWIAAPTSTPCPRSRVPVRAYSKARGIG